VGVKFGDVVHMSEPVPVSEEEVGEQRYRNDLGKTLYIDSYVNMPIFTECQGQKQVTIIIETFIYDDRMFFDIVL
jgi:hypothetical protein